jgi:hypothetical protein
MSVNIHSQDFNVSENDMVEVFLKPVTEEEEQKWKKFVQSKVEK